MKTYNIKGKKLTVDYLNIDKTLYALLEALDEREALSDKEESKQPISLGVEIERIVRLHTHEDRVDEADIAEDVLSLIHSHLIKEIQLITNLNGEIEHEDIIKIINNITK